MISVSHLTKRYGDFTAVDDLSFEIEDGHIYGFLGPNGAGKSTTMNIMTGCLSMTDGEVTIDGLDIFEDAKEAKKHIGYLPEIPPVYLETTPDEYLEFVGKAKGLRGDELWEQIDNAVSETGLEEVRGRLIKNLSKGYRQRVGIAQALLGHPSVIILDEPTVGLDPIQITEIRALIRSLGENRTVILSSHILSEVQEICEKVLIINKGKLVAFDTPENLEQIFAEKCTVKLKVLGDKKQTENALSTVECVKECEIQDDGNGYLSADVTLNNNDSTSGCTAISLALGKAGIAVIQMTPVKVSLEDIFIELTAGSKQEKEEEE